MYNKVQINTSEEDFVNEVCKQVQLLCQHHFIKMSFIYVKWMFLNFNNIYLRYKPIFCSKLGFNV